ncbi:Ldh family oxidoreductase [Orrella sp. 11846]|uniref:Ldh family oxidoreductase n=1 Tax=Orrella sp. 11846 TaxID=3409913 RepID=UPI003B5AE670
MTQSTNLQTDFQAILHNLEAARGQSIFLTTTQLLVWASKIFERAGLSSQDAMIMARTCVYPERDGALSHGLFRLPNYLQTLVAGNVNINAQPTVVQETPSLLVVDAQNGLAQPALQTVYEQLVQKTRETGLCVVLLRRAFHIAALWMDVEPLARQGFVALTCVNASSCVAPAPGTSAVYGTNPMAFACPREGHEPLVFDQASSLRARGDVMLSARAGEEVPLGTGMNSEGELTQNPKEILKGGALLPFGGYKGASIAMMVEILAAALTGGQFSWEIDRWSQPTPDTASAGQFLLCIDPTVAGQTMFAQRIQDLAQKLLDSGQSRLPGDLRYTTRAKTESEGIKVDADLLLGWYEQTNTGVNTSG